jgi:hypothetical protein
MRRIDPDDPEYRRPPATGELGPLFEAPPPILRGLARNPDWSTSVDAAEAVSDILSELQGLVLGYLQQYGPSTDERINEAFEAAYPGRYAESTVRHRRSDLSKRGLVRSVGITKNSRGQTVALWGVA